MTIDRKTRRKLRPVITLKPAELLWVVEAGLLLTVAVFFALGYLSYLAAHRTITNFHYDFAFFYTAFSVVWHHSPTSLMYDKPLEQAFLRQHGYIVNPPDEYVYPPQFAVFFSFLASLPYRAASMLWTVFAFVGYALSVILLGRLGFVQRGRGRLLTRRGAGFPWLVFAALCAANDGFNSDVLLGNVTWLLLLLITLGFYLRYTLRWKFLAGVPMGIAAVIKITPAVLFFYYLLRREWRMAFGILTGAAISSVVAAFVIGWRTLWQFVTAFYGLFHSSMQNGPAPHNLSFEGDLAYLANVAHVISPAAVSPVFLAILVGLALLVIWLIWSGRVDDPRADMALAALCVIVFSPLVEGTHLLLLLISITMVFSLWWSEYTAVGKTMSRTDSFWLGTFALACLMLSLVREIVDHLVHGSALLVPGYLLLVVAVLWFLSRLRPSEESSALSQID